MAGAQQAGEPPLGLGAWGAPLILVGSALGSGTFIAKGDIVRPIHHPGLILRVWVIGGLLAGLFSLES
jgi:hypothetical protein